MDDLRIGVVGLGQRSVIADHAHHPGTGSRIVAVCDPDRGRLDRARQRYGEVAAVTDHRALAELSLDAVLVVTPDHVHEPVCTDLLTAGIPTFVDKPLAITVEGCDRILAAARDAGTKLYVGHNMRHLPTILTMKELIDKGEIGEVRTIWCRHFVGHGGDYYFKDWHADRRNTTGLLLQKGAHDLDVMHWLAGGYAVRVHAMGGLVVYGDVSDRRERTGQIMPDWYDPEHNWPPLSQRGLHPVIDVEDLSLVNLRLDNGVFASYQQCHFTPDYWRSYTVIGTEGRLENFGDTDGATVKVWNRRRSGYREDADIVVPILTDTGGHGGADPRLVEEFLRYVRDGVPTRTSPVAARYAVAAGHAATVSLREDGRPVDVPALAPALAAHFGATGRTRVGRVGESA